MANNIALEAIGLTATCERHPGVFSG